jgi:hypothetical protein
MKTSYSLSMETRLSYQMKLSNWIEYVCWICASSLLFSDASLFFFLTYLINYLGGKREKGNIGMVCQKKEWKNQDEFLLNIYIVSQAQDKD